MATLGSLVIQLQADLARLRSDMGKAVNLVEGGMSSIRAAAGLAKSALGGLAVGIAGGLTASALVQAVKTAADYGDHLNDLSKATGATVEQLSFLDYAAKQSGASLDGLVGSIGKLQKNLAEVSKGGGKEAGKALEVLGLNARELSQTDLVTQLSTIADGLSRIKNPSERAATAQAIFGKSARDLLPLLSAGGAGIKQMADRFVELGGVVTQAQADKFDALNDSFGDFNVALRAISVNVAEAVSGPLTNFATWVVQAPDKIATGLSKITASFGVWVDETKVALAEADVATAEGLKNLIPGNVGDSFFDRRIKQSNDDLAKARAALRKSQELAALESGNKPTSAADVLGKAGNIGAVSEGISDAQAKAIESLKKSQESYLDGLRKQIILQSNATELAKVQADIAGGTASKFDADTQRQAVALATQIDLLNDRKVLIQESAEVEEVMAGYVKERAQLEAKATADLVAKRQATTDALMTPLEKYIARVKELIDLGLGEETLQRGIKTAREEMETAQTKADALKGAAKDLGLTFSSAFEDAIVGAKSFGDILKGLASDITRILVRKSVTEPLAEALGGFLNSSGGGGGLAAMFGGLFGNARGGLYKVGGGAGEHPVAFTAKAGEVVAVGTGMAGGGGGLIINNFGAQVRDRGTQNGQRVIDVFLADSVSRSVGAGRMAPAGLRPALAAR